MSTKLTEKLILSWFTDDSGVSNRILNVNSKKINIFFIDCLIDKNYLSQNIITPLLKCNKTTLYNIKQCLSSCEILQSNNKQQITFIHIKYIFLQKYTKILN